jgi:hypothetical protein
MRRIAVRRAAIGLLNNDEIRPASLPGKVRRMVLAVARGIRAVPAIRPKAKYRRQLRKVSLKKCGGL